MFDRKSTFFIFFNPIAKQILAVAFFTIGWNNQAVAQSADSVYINKLQYEGLKRTRASFMGHCVGFDAEQKVSITQIEKAQQSILNSNFFSSVNYELIDEPAGKTLKFVVAEKFTVLPSFSGGSSKHNSWFVVGVNDFHFLGRGIMLGAFYIYNQRSGFISYMSFPYIKGTKWGAEVSGENFLTIEPVYFENDISYGYNLNRINALLLVTRELKRYKQSIQLGVNWRKESYELYDELDNNIPYIPNIEVHDRFLGVFKYVDKSRLNNFEQYQFGYSFEASFERAIVDVRSRNFGRLTLEGKYFRLIGGKGNLATRLKLSVTENTNTPFAPLYLDNFWNLRGVGYVAKRGTAELTMNIEHRQTIFNRSWMAIQGVAFVDYSGLRSPGGDFSEVLKSEHNHIYSGIGGRVNFKRITDFILRLDYGFSLKDSKRGFVFGVNQYF